MFFFLLIDVFFDVESESEIHFNSKTRGERPKWISDSDSTSKIKLTKPNLLITSKLLVFHAYLIHYFYNSKNKGERQKLTSDSDSTSKNT